MPVLWIRAEKTRCIGGAFRSRACRSMPYRVVRPRARDRAQASLSKQFRQRRLAACRWGCRTRRARFDRPPGRGWWGRFLPPRARPIRPNRVAVRALQEHRAAGRHRVEVAKRERYSGRIDLDHLEPELALGRLPPLACQDLGFDVRRRQHLIFKAALVLILHLSAG